MRLDRMMVLALCVLILAALPCVAQDAAEDELLLRFNYEQGERLTYETTMDGVGSVHVMGQAQAIELKGKMLVTMLVEEINEEGNYVISTDVDIAELTVRVEGSAVPPPQQHLATRVVMSPRGEILEIEMAQMIDERGEASPWNEQMARMLTGGFDLNQMIMGQKVAAFPEGPVKPGDEWQGAVQEVEVQGQVAPLEITTKYDGTIELDGRACARLDSEMTMQSAALGELATALNMQGFTTNQARSWFDFEAGRTLATMEKTQVSMQVMVPAAMTGGHGAAGVSLELFVDTQSKLLPAAAD